VRKPKTKNRQESVRNFRSKQRDRAKSKRWWKEAKVRDLSTFEMPEEKSEPMEEPVALDFDVFTFLASQKLVRATVPEPFGSLVGAPDKWHLVRHTDGIPYYQPPPGFCAYEHDDKTYHEQLYPNGAVLRLMTTKLWNAMVGNLEDHHYSRCNRLGCRFCRDARREMGSFADHWRNAYQMARVHPVNPEAEALLSVIFAQKEEVAIGLAVRILEERPELARYYDVQGYCAYSMAVANYWTSTNLARLIGVGAHAGLECSFNATVCGVDSSTYCDCSDCRGTFQDAQKARDLYDQELAIAIFNSSVPLPKGMVYTLSPNYSYAKQLELGLSLNEDTAFKVMDQISDLDLPTFLSKNSIGYYYSCDEIRRFEEQRITLEELTKCLYQRVRWWMALGREYRKLETMFLSYRPPAIDSIVRNILKRAWSYQKRRSLLQLRFRCRQDWERQCDLYMATTSLTI
jgi:hypothetical protein